MGLARALVIFNIGTLMCVAYVWELSEYDGVRLRVPFELAAGAVAVCWRFLCPIASIVGVATWGGTRYPVALVVHPILLTLWLMLAPLSRSMF